LLPMLEYLFVWLSAKLEYLFVCKAEYLFVWLSAKLEYLVVYIA
jgi:hypothetical protein